MICQFVRQSPLGEPLVWVITGAGFHWKPSDEWNFKELDNAIPVTVFRNETMHSVYLQVTRRVWSSSGTYRSYSRPLDSPLSWVQHGLYTEMCWHIFAENKWMNFWHSVLPLLLPGHSGTVTMMLNISFQGHKTRKEIQSGKIIPSYCSNNLIWQIGTQNWQWLIGSFFSAYDSIIIC